MKRLLRIISIVVLLGAAFLCVLKNPQLPVSQNILRSLGLERLLTGQTSTLANPASVYCEQQSGLLEIVTDLSGGQSGICHLTGGVDCEEWAYMRGECPATGTTVIGMDVTGMNVVNINTTNVDSDLSSGDVSYGGIGVILDWQVSNDEDPFPVIIRILADSPAFKAGLQPQDLIIMVDGVSLRGADPVEVASNKLSGSIGSTIMLTIKRPQMNTGPMLIEKEMVRELVHIPAQPTYTIDGNPITPASQRIGLILACEGIVGVEQDPIGDFDGDVDGYFVRIGKSIPLNNNIKKYAIQWSNGNRTEYTVGDADESYPDIRNSRAYFTDHPFKILECDEYKQITGTENEVHNPNFVYAYGKGYMDPDSVKYSLGYWGYVKVNNQIYYKEASTSKIQLSGVDVDTFKVIECEGAYNKYARDKNKLYRYGNMIEISGADLDTLQIFGDQGYVKDKNSVYFDTYSSAGYVKIEGADPLTFAVGTDFARDKNHVFGREFLLTGADVETFEMLGDGSGYAKDKYHVYGWASESEEGWYIIEGANPSTFVIPE